MKLLFFHNSLPEYRIELFEELNKQCDVTIVITNPQVYEKKYGFSTSKKTNFDCYFLSEGRKGFKELNDILNQIDKYDAVELPPLDTLREIIIGKKIISAAKKNHKKIGFFWEKWDAPKAKQPIERKIKNSILRVIPKQIYKSADIIQAGSKSAKKYFIDNGIKTNRVIVVPDVSKTPSCAYINIRSKYKIPNDKILLLYFGRLMDQKGLDYLIKSLAILNKSSNSFFLLVVGNGDFLNYCKRLANELNISNIEFCGAVDPRLRKNYFEQCDVFVFPGTYRGGRVDVWGLTINEAMQFYKPVVSTEAVGSAKDLIQTGVNGYVVEPENEIELSQGIVLSLTLDKSNLIKKDKNIDKVYSYKNMAKQIINSLLD
ncbi:glycosyltransferase family 4 protein [Lactobacillus crispatus]|uniref:glycosyltransferase family 4 protein n=1 Tax=Lactobacillus crispatus TaxID=47770 RepID=UPI0025A4A3E6|nr:glycosyltransferase family 4 protein [Lactobacillus crispatus]MDM8290910.1 glycosyltransferase family 4 protein [Lactobacillus crispatus]